MPYKKIALTLLEREGDGEFDVDFGDVNVTEHVRTELELLGCKVEQAIHGTKLVVTPPADRKAEE